MISYFILIKKKNSKGYLGAVPAKKGAKLDQLKLTLKRLKPGFQGRIVTKTQLVSLLKRMSLKKTKRKPSKKRK